MRDRDRRYIGYDYLDGDFVYGEDICNIGYEGELWFYTGYPDIMVSDYGRVYNAKTKHFLKPKRGDKKGHLCVCVRNAAGEKKYPYVHHMMAEAFVDNYRGDPIVRHLDDDPRNNEIENLAWGTKRDNAIDCIRNGFAHFVTDEEREIGMQKMRRPVLVTNLRTGKQQRYRSIVDACRCLGIQTANASKVLAGIRQHTCGYFFEYAED